VLDEAIWRMLSGSRKAHGGEMQRARLAPLAKRATQAPAGKPTRRRKRRSRKRKGGDAGIDGSMATGAPAVGLRLDPAPGAPSALREPVVTGSRFGSALESARSSGAHPLPGELLKGMVRSRDTDLSGVRIHTDARAGLLSSLLRARAFTVGRDVFFKSGAFRPGSAEGRRLIGHELVPPPVPIRPPGRIPVRIPRVPVRVPVKF
jgi:hypothetical protein